MKRSVFLLLPLFLAACSSVPTSKVVQESADKAPLLTVVGAAPLDGDYTRAVQVAKADAAASVVKFLASQVRSSSESLSRTDDGITVHSGFNKTTENAASMVRGLVFEEEIQEGDRVIVHGVISLDSISRARRLQVLMR